MEDTDDPGLMTLLHDVLRLVHGFWYLLKLILTASYISGKILFEWSHCIGVRVWETACNAADGLQAIFHAVIELEEACIRGLVLVHLTISHLHEAFQVTLTDFVGFLEQVQVKNVELLDAASNSCLRMIQVLFVTVPQHICMALCIIGDFVLDVFIQLMSFFQNFFVQLIWSPINAAMAVCSLGIQATLLPGKILSSIPFSAHVGSVIIILIYILYCKLSFIRFLRLLTSSVLLIFQTVRQVPYFFNQVRKVVSNQLLMYQKDSALPGDMMGVCVVCQSNIVSYLANPCNHVCLCSVCVREIVQVDNRCPMCRNEVDHYCKVYVS